MANETPVEATTTTQTAGDSGGEWGVSYTVRLGEPARPNRKFWMLMTDADDWDEPKESRTFYRKEDAIREASRLARKHVNRSLYVMESVEHVRADVSAITTPIG